MAKSARERMVAYGGYRQTHSPAADRELTRVGPGSPCGEYFRRFWHPVALSAELSDRPRRLRVLGEDLVLFRKPGGAVGLVHLHCAHRRASLEFGTVEAAGIRCCYHGWLYDVDGTILDTPLEPADSPIKANVRLGAYPAREFMGFVFAYLGPPEELPEFPLYDTFEIDWKATAACAHHFPCNWLQVADNSMDHDHTVYLHSPPDGDKHFAETWGRHPAMEYRTRSIGLYYNYSRRVGENVWVGSEDVLLPNVTQAGAVWTMDGRKRRYFGRGSFTRWVVPLDDTDTVVFSLAHFGPRSDPAKAEYLTPEALDRLEMGTPRHRAYEEAQRVPGDAEAIVSQGPVNIHRLEHLGHTDRGVSLYRRSVRREIRALKRGRRPCQPMAAYGAPIPTYAGDSVLRIPPQSGRDDGDLVREVSARVLDIYASADHLTGAARDSHIQAEVRDLEREYAPARKPARRKAKARR